MKMETRKTKKETLLTRSLLMHDGLTGKGEMSITWFGPVPRVTITKPELVREVLSNKFGHFEKLKFGRLQRMLHNGVGSHEGEKWARHRRIINPAFHLEKLKVIYMYLLFLLCH
jgi:cytochrome P450